MKHSAAKPQPKGNSPQRRRRGDFAVLQREAQQRKEEEHLQSPEMPTASTKKQAAEQSKMDENRPNK